MQLIRRRDSWNPLREMEELSNRMSRLFNLTSSGDGERELLATTDWAPSCDIRESEKEYRIQAELPGVKKEDVRVTLENGVLTIQGERKEEKEEKGEKLHRREVSYGNFMRQFSMPDDSDDAKVDATFKDGILNVKIAKSPAKASKAKQIAVQ